MYPIPGIRGVQSLIVAFHHLTVIVDIRNLVFLGILPDSGIQLHYLLRSILHRRIPAKGSGRQHRRQNHLYLIGPCQLYHRHYISKSVFFIISACIFRNVIGTCIYHDQRRSKLEVIVDEIEFMSSRGGQGGYDQGGYAPAAPAPAARPAAPVATPPAVDVYDEDIPF